MSLEVKIHNVQLLILRELLFHPSANYAKLQRPTGLTSDHFNFHISRLVELGLVERLEKGLYRLTITGKEYANKLDTANNTIERQPKMAVMLVLEKHLNGKLHYLIQERIKNPNYGFFGFPTGKVRWGETILQTAQRECQEETGLQADFEITGAYHEHVRLEESDELLEDKIFFICRGTNAKGQMQDIFEGGRNQWLTPGDLMQKEKRFSSVESEMEILNTDTWLIENTVHYPKNKF
jgi:8-oxo-dGTP pyrophosphatase MutT (NUDIX family)